MLHIQDGSASMTQSPLALRYGNIMSEWSIGEILKVYFCRYDSHIILVQDNVMSEWSSANSYASVQPYNAGEKCNIQLKWQNSLKNVKTTTDYELHMTSKGGSYNKVFNKGRLKLNINNIPETLYTMVYVSLMTSL